MMLLDDGNAECVSLFLQFLMMPMSNDVAVCRDARIAQAGKCETLSLNRTEQSAIPPAVILKVVRLWAVG